MLPAIPAASILRSIYPGARIVVDGHANAVIAKLTTGVHYFGDYDYYNQSYSTLRGILIGSTPTPGFALRRGADR